MNLQKGPWSHVIAAIELSLGRSAAAELEDEGQKSEGSRQHPAGQLAAITKV